MSRIPPVDRNTTNDSVQKNFDAVQKQLGVVPNMMRTMAQSPSVLEGYLGFGAALRRGRLPVGAARANRARRRRDEFVRLLSLGAYRAWPWSGTLE